MREIKPEDIDSLHPTFQVLAMQKSAEMEVPANLSRQVELLASEDPAVRFYAILSLKRLTGTDNGYNYRHDPAKRRESIAIWKTWLVENGHNTDDQGHSANERE